MVALVCPVRPGADENPELRYALRSWQQNIEHDELWIVGHKPGWVENARFIEGNPHDDKPRNVFANILLACEHPDVPEDIVIMNDDMFALKPYTPQVEYRGLLRDHLRGIRRSSWWKQSLDSTVKYFDRLGIPAPLSYELHTPLPASKSDMAKALREAADWTPKNPPQWRTVYGVRCEIGGTQTSDTKVYREKAGDWQEWALISTSDPAWNTPVGRHVEGLFPHPSVYEGAPYWLW